MHRRELLRGASGMIALSAIAGCAGLIGPDPRVAEAEAQGGFVDQLGGEADIEMTVINEGRAGDVVVSVEVYDAEDTLLERYREEINMEADERRRVTIRVEVPEDADHFHAGAEAA